MLRKTTKTGGAKPAGKMEAAETDKLRAAVAEIALEEWRFRRAIEKVLSRMDPMEAERFGRQYGYFTSRVDQAVKSAGLSCQDLTGQFYDVGMAVTAMNLEEFEEEDRLIITSMIEPVLLYNGRVIKTGMAMLGRVPEEEQEEA